jgi:hypothetical protein
MNTKAKDSTAAIFTARLGFLVTLFGGNSGVFPSTENHTCDCKLESAIPFARNGIGRDAKGFS